MVIRLQLIDGYFYPTDSCSKEFLLEELRLTRFAEEKLDYFSPSLIRKGHAFAIANYSPKVRPEIDRSGWMKVGGSAKCVENPCKKCYLRDLCDKDDCGRKHFRILSRN